VQKLFFPPTQIRPEQHRASGAAHEAPSLTHIARAAFFLAAEREAEVVAEAAGCAMDDGPATAADEAGCPRGTAD
jgi:hypothetical protein